MAYRPRTKHIPGTKAHQRYYITDPTTKERIQVPGASTVAKIPDAWRSQKSLMRWANGLGLDGYNNETYVSKLADVGTLLHEMCMEVFQGGKFDPLFDKYTKWTVTEAKKSFKKFEAWAVNHKLEPICMEKQFTSSIYRFGGTIDWFGKVDGLRTLLDYKTSKGVFPSHWYQIAGYNEVIFEDGGYQAQQVGVVQVGRNEKEGFTTPIITSKQIMHYWEVFRLGLQIYWLQKDEPRFY